MTVWEVGLDALQLLGEVDEYGIKNDQAVLKRVVHAVDTVYRDLYFISQKETEFKRPIDIDDEISLPDHAVHDIMPYGVAMWLAQQMGDDNNYNYMAVLYNQKRCELSAVKQIEDVWRDEISC